MNLVSELIADLRYMIQYRRRLMPIHKRLDRLAPRAGDLAPDFTLTDSTGTKTVTLSQFRGLKPVVLVFGSYT
jgi:hypothetical protein